LHHGGINNLSGLPTSLMKSLNSRLTFSSRTNSIIKDFNEDLNSLSLSTEIIDEITILYMIMKKLSVILVGLVGFEPESLMVVCWSSR